MKWILRITLLIVLTIGLAWGIFWPIWFILWMAIYKVTKSYLFNIKITNVELKVNEGEFQFFEFEYKMDGNTYTALGRISNSKKFTPEDIKFYLNSEVSKDDMKQFKSNSYLQKKVEDASLSMVLEVYKNPEVIPA
jgi:hypothetical protein